MYGISIMLWLHAGLVPGARAMLVGSRHEDVAAVREACELPALPSFDHEMRRAALRRRQRHGASAAELRPPAGG